MGNAQLASRLVTGATTPVSVVATPATNLSKNRKMVRSQLRFRLEDMVMVKNQSRSSLEAMVMVRSQLRLSLEAMVMVKSQLRFHSGTEKSQLRSADTAEGKNQS